VFNNYGQVMTNSDYNKSKSTQDHTCVTSENLNLFAVQQQK